MPRIGRGINRDLERCRGRATSLVFDLAFDLDRVAPVGGRRRGDQRGIDEVGQRRLAIAAAVAVAARSSRRSRDSSLRMIGPRPQARRSPAARRSWDDMIVLLLEIAAHATFIGRAFDSGRNRHREPAQRSLPSARSRCACSYLDPSMGFCGTLAANRIGQERLVRSRSRDHDHAAGGLLRSAAIGLTASVHGGRAPMTRPVAPQVRCRSSSRVYDTVMPVRSGRWSGRQVFAGRDGESSLTEQLIGQLGYLGIALILILGVWGCRSPRKRRSSSRPS